MTLHKDEVLKEIHEAQDYVFQNCRANDGGLTNYGSDTYGWLCRLEKDFLHGILPTKEDAWDSMMAARTGLEQDILGLFLHDIVEDV